MSLVYSLVDLKPTLATATESVECPVQHCSTVVARARRGEPLRQQNFFCPKHRIYLSPSTFEYEDELDNLLWRDGSDRELLAMIKRVKRECRFARENSEDALTWNVMRGLERSGTVASWLSAAIGTVIDEPRIDYWSYDSASGGANRELARAREEFGEAPRRGTEPDVVVTTSTATFWIEAKLGSTNETTPSAPNTTKKYLTGGSSWFKHVFRRDYAAVAVEMKRYELMRLWLLGTWAAAQERKAFYLMNLVREDARENVFEAHIADVPNARLIIVTWEQLYDWLLTESGEHSSNKIAEYLRNKSLGYRAGRVEAAFPRLAEGKGD